MLTGMVLVLCIQTAKHRIVNADLVVHTKGRFAGLRGTGRRPFRCFFKVTRLKVRRVFLPGIRLLVVMLASITIGMVALLDRS